MALVDETGRAVNDQWDAPDAAVLTVEDALHALTSETDETVAVTASADDDLDALVPYLDRLGLIELTFGQFKDGRPFTAAFTLRKRYGFKGELRAAGDILPDQAVALVRSGFSSLRVPDAFTPDEFAQSLSAYTLAYQSAAGGSLRTISGERQRVPDLAAE